MNKTHKKGRTSAQKSSKPPRPVSYSTNPHQYVSHSPILRTSQIIQKQPKDNQCKRFVLRPHFPPTLATH